MHTILVIEDQKLLRLMLCDELKKNDFHTLEAEDGIEGMDKVENEDISLIITDLIMPNLEGVDFLNLLSNCYPDIKVIAWTSLLKEHPTYQEAAEIIGEDKIITKTDSMDGLVANVKSLLG